MRPYQAQIVENQENAQQPNGRSEPALSWSSPYFPFDGCWSKIPILAEIFWRAPLSTTLLQQGWAQSRLAVVVDVEAFLVVEIVEI